LHFASYLQYIEKEIKKYKSLRFSDKKLKNKKITGLFSQIAYPQHKEQKANHYNKPENSSFKEFPAGMPKVHGFAAYCPIID